MSNLYDIDPDAASRRRHPTVTDMDLEQEVDEGFADLDASLDQLADATVRLHAMVLEFKQVRERTPRTDHLMCAAALTTGFAIATLLWLLLFIATAAGARP